MYTVLLAYTYDYAIPVGTSRYKTMDFVFEPSYAESRLETLRRAIAYAERAKGLMRRKGFTTTEVVILDANDNEVENY